MNRITTSLWDAADHLKTEEDIIAYLESALENGDPSLISAVLGDIAREKGMTKIAQQTDNYHYRKSNKLVSSQ